MPRGSATSWSSGHCSRGTCHGRSSRAGSLGAASIRSGMGRLRCCPETSVDQALAGARREEVQVTLLGREVDLLALLRRPAAVDARDDVVVLAVDLGAAVDVSVGAELLDDVDGRLETLPGADEVHVLRTDADGDLAVAGLLRRLTGNGDLALAEPQRVAVQRDRQQVHGGGADEAGDEDVVGVV